MVEPTPLGESKQMRSGWHTRWKVAASLCVTAGLAVQGPSSVQELVAQQPQRSANVNWPLGNQDLAGTRFSPSKQITRANVETLTPRFLFQHGIIDGVSNQTTPVVVNGVMYVTDSRGSVYAVDATNGHLLWQYDVTEFLGGGAREGYIFRNRGVAYADGTIYTVGGSFLFALNAETGKPLQTFGKNGQSSALLDVIRLRHSDAKTAISLGYSFTAAPQVHNGIVYVGANRSESLIPGGYVLAIDGKTGKVVWHFNTIPQDEKDQGWELAGPTWAGSERHGGGIWSTPPIDPALGLLYVSAGNPFGNSKNRAGTNLFTDSIIALTLDKGIMKWYFQETHHDVWDYDTGAPATLFDMQVGGRRVRALAHGSKNGYLYILNRETGEPVHPIKELPVPPSPDASDPLWPTQPFPFTAAGKPMEPLYPIPAVDIAPSQLAKGFKAVPAFTPRGPNQVSPYAGNSYAPASYNPQLGLLYTAAIDNPHNSGRGPKGAISAYNPATGELVWRQSFEGYGQSGPVSTAGGLVFVGAGSNLAGYFYAYDAKTGELLWKFNTGSGVFSAPSVYVVDGEEYVTVASGGGERGRRGGALILSFALPKR
jgi:alcohol dehydrogenase (cytochrome c)